MKLIDSEGTNKSNFSIGLGENKADLKTINGQLFFRNFGGGYSQVASTSTNNATVPREWAAGTVYLEDELIYFNGAVWICLSEHTSGVSFLATVDNLTKIADVSNFVNINITSDSNPYVLDVYSSDYIYVEGSNASFEIRLPSALQLNVGRRYFIQNSSLSTITIADNTGTVLTTILPNLAYTFSLLQAVTTAGSWSSFQIVKESDTDLKVLVNASSGPLAVGDIVYNAAGTWTVLDYYSKEKFKFGEIGIVREINPSDFTVLIGGRINFDDTPITLSANTDYYLSKTTPGLFTTTESDVYLFKSIDTKNAIFLPSYRNDRVRTRITQSGHGFVSGNPIYFTGSAWAKADASVRANFAQGIAEVIDANNFYITQLGLVELPTADWDVVKESGTGGLVTGTIYYLSGVTPGKITATAPTTDLSQTVLQAISTTRALLLSLDSEPSGNITTNSPLSVVADSGAVNSPIEISIAQSDTSTDGYLSSTDWNTFNDKQNSLTSPFEDSAATGTVADYDAGTNARIIFDTVTSLSGIVPRTVPSDSALIITNTNTVDLLIVNDAASTASHRIITGTGKDLKLKPQATLFLIYDTAISRWRVVGGSGSGGGGGASTEFTSSISFPVGSPVFYDGVDFALASAASEVSGVQYVVSEKTGSGPYTYVGSSAGEIELTTGEWDDVTVVSGGLVPGDIYFLSSSTPGKIDTTPGLLYSPVLRALSTTKAFISLSINNTESGMGDTFYRDTVVTVGDTTDITLTYAPSGKAYVWLSLDGVFQSGSAFDLAGSTITFGSTIPTGVTIDVIYARAVLLGDVGAINRMVSFTETVSGSPKTVFNLPSVPSGAGSCIAWVGGAIQDDTKWNLNGNVLTFTDPVPVGVQVVVYVLNSSGVTQIDSYVTRAQHTISPDGTITFDDVFGNTVSARYRFHELTDPLLEGKILLKYNGIGVDPDVRVVTESSDVTTTMDTASKLNMYIDGNIFTIQNKFGISKTLVFFREI